MKKAGRLSLKALSLFLSVLLVLTAFPAAALAEYYYPEGTKFIKDIGLCWASEAENGRKYIAEACEEWINVDLNAGTGSHTKSVFMG